MLLASRDRAISAVVYSHKKKRPSLKTEPPPKIVRSGRIRVSVVEKKRARSTDPRIAELVINPGIGTQSPGPGTGVPEDLMAAHGEVVYKGLVSVTEEEETAILSELQSES